jgi:hypothetical protein
MDITKNEAIEYARELFTKVRAANPSFTEDMVLTHTAEGTAEHFELTTAQEHAVRAELEAEQSGIHEY